MLDPRTQPKHTHVDAFDPLGQVNDRHDNPGLSNFGLQPRKGAQNYEKYRSWNGGGLQFKPDVVDDESGVCSPPLWGQTSPSRSPVHSQHNFPNLSPTSRTQAIAKGQKELMDMVKAMPESSYELSLKDLVDYHMLNGHENNQQECLVEKETSLSKKGSVKKQESIKKKAKIVRSGSNIDQNHKGLFLKMVFPVSFGGSSRRKKANINPYAKVSPKTTSLDENKPLKDVDKEWWKKRNSVSDESESGGISSINSGSTGSTGSSGSSTFSRGSSRRSNSTRKKSGCLYVFPAFYSKKNKSAE